MKKDLKERYLYAVTKRLSPRIREDVSMELRGLMEDMLLERCGEAEPTEEDVKAVMQELGTPAELYARYADDADACLIGQPYYSSYKLALKIVLSCVAVGMTIAAMLLTLVQPRSIWETLEYWLSTEVDCLLATFAVLTLVFALMSRNKTKIDGLFDLDELPPVPKKKSQISIWDPIWGMAFHMVFLLVFLIAPQAFSARVEGVWIPTFDAEVIRQHWYILALFSLAGVTRETVKLMERRFNKRVLQVTLAVNILSAGLAIWWLSGPSIVSAQLLQKLDVLFPKDAIVIPMFDRMNIFLLCCILLALVLDLGEAVVKYEKE